MREERERDCEVGRIDCVLYARLRAARLITSSMAIGTNEKRSLQHGSANSE